MLGGEKEMLSIVLKFRTGIFNPSTEALHVVYVII